MSDGLPGILVVVLLASFVYLAVAIVLAVRRITDTSGKMMARRIDAVTKRPTIARNEDLADLVKRHEMSGLHWLDALLSRQQWSQRMNKKLAQANIDAPLGVFVLLSLTLVVVGFMLTSFYLENIFLRLAIALALGTLPFQWINRRKKKRMLAFETQLPEALELVGRALKAGHTFASGMGMVVEEFGDPIRGEFHITLEEINFGVGVTTALDNLMDRVDCPDLNFFVVSVKIQNETGGNLAEIVENIALLIRERFKLKGRVQVLSAEGRLTAWVLCLLPFGVAAVVHMLNPDYMDPLFTHPIGRMLSYLVLGMMTFGVLVVRKMVQIDV